MTTKFVTLGLALLLAGCHESYPQDYLMEHPDILNKEILQCRANSEYTPYCDHIKQVMEDFTALSAIRSNDPELFGKQILQAQIDLVHTDDMLHELRLDLQKLQMQHASKDQLDAAEKKLQLMEQSYQAQSQKIKQLLAVVAATSMRD